MGRITRVRIFQVLAPSIRALSSSSRGIAMKNCRRKNTPKAPAAPGMISASNVSSQCSRFINR